MLARVEERIQELWRKVEAHLAVTIGAAVKVADLAPLAGGACQDNVRVEVELPPELGGARRLVLRSDAMGSLAGSLTRREEFHVIQTAVAAQVKTPAARWLARDLAREGAFAYFLDWVEGDAIGRKIVRDEKLASARAKLPAEVATELAKIHAITPASAPDLAAMLELPADDDPATAALRRTRESLDGLPAPRPGLELAMEWLHEHKPEPREVTLVHGDFRTGNFMVTPSGLSAVLDWEFAHFGAPENDLSWITLRDWRFGRDDLPVGGFGRREEFYAAYEAASGRRVRRSDVHWWEVLGNVRWASGCIEQGERYAKGEHDIELIAIPLRAAEMEFEALRLVQEGPPAEGSAHAASRPIAAKSET